MIGMDQEIFYIFICHFDDTFYLGFYIKLNEDVWLHHMMALQPSTSRISFI